MKSKPADANESMRDSEVSPDKKSAIMNSSTVMSNQLKDFDDFGFDTQR